MKILLTGGAGFIGSNVADAYIREGHDVIVVDNLFTGRRENLNPRARFYLMDIRSAEMKKLFDFERPDIVNHHAAQMSVPASVQDPGFDADVNVSGFINVLEAAKSSGVRKVIFISSGGAIYGEAEEYPTSERSLPVPRSPYAITKAVSEQYLFYYRHQYGLDYTVLRYANVYGPRQIPHGEAGVVALFMDRLLSNSPCTLNHFKEEPRGMTRDYCFVGDVAEANLKAIDKGSGQAFNIGTGAATHTEDLFNLIYNAVKANIVIDSSVGRLNRAQARGGDLKRSCLNVDKARSLLCWNPSVDLARGIELTLKWRMGR